LGEGFGLHGGPLALSFGYEQWGRIRVNMQPLRKSLTSPLRGFIRPVLGGSRGTEYRTLSAPGVGCAGAEAAKRPRIFVGGTVHLKRLSPDPDGRLASQFFDFCGEWLHLRRPLRGKDAYSMRACLAFSVIPLRVNHPEEGRATGVVNGQDELVG
jgi:hypothetical protein